MEPKILEYREGIYQYTPDLLSSEGDHEIDVNINSELRMRRDSDVVAFQMTFDFRSREESVMTYGFVIAMSVAGWIPITTGDAIDNSSKESEYKSISEIIFSRAPEQINKTCRAVMDFARGAMCAKLGDTTQSPIRFPDVKMDEFIKTINLKVMN